MTETVFRTSTPAVIPAPSEFVENKTGVTSNELDIQPVEEYERESGKDIVLESLGIDDSLANMPEADRQNVPEVKKYISEIIKSRGLVDNKENFSKVFNEVRDEMGLDPNTEPSVVLDRIGGVISAWKSISFIRDSKEKRSIFMKLARQPDSSSMNRLVFEEMEKRTVWR